MKTWQLSCVCALVYGLVGCNSHIEPARQIGAINECYELTPAERKIREVRAENGDASAAVELANFYLLAASNMQKGIYWLRRAAILGDVSSQYNLGICLLRYNSGGVESEEGMHWLKVASDNGSALARKELQWRKTHR